MTPVELEDELVSFYRDNLRRIAPVVSPDIRVQSEVQQLGVVARREEYRPKQTNRIPQQVFQPALTITDVSPLHGPEEGGQNITLHGTGFVMGCTIEFIGDDSTSMGTFLNVTSDGTIMTVETQMHDSPELCDVKVTNPDGESATDPDSYMFDATLDIYTIDPNTGSTAGGTAFTIYGVGFAAGMTIKFAGLSATSIVIVDDGTATGVTPAHAAGSVDVTVQNLDGTIATLSGGFTYGGSGNPAAVEIDVTGDGSSYLSQITIQSGVTYPFNVYALSSFIPKVIDTSFNGTMTLQIVNTDPMLTIFTGPPTGSVLNFTAGVSLFFLEGLVSAPDGLNHFADIYLINPDETFYKITIGVFRDV